MKKYLKFTAMALCVAMLAGCGGSGPNDGGMPVEEAKKTSVEIANPTMDTVKDEYMYSGTIEAADTVDVTAKVQGTVSATYFEVGDTVTKGAVLYKIDDTDYQNSLKTAEASLNSANAGVRSAQTSVDTANGATMKTQLESAKNAITNAETSLETAQKSLDDARIAKEKAESDYEINSQLYEVGGISQDTLNNYKNAVDNANNAYSRAENSVTSANNALEQAKTSYNILEKETTAENTRKANDSLNSALASQKTASVQVDNAKQQISYCTVTSPISGTVLTKNVTAGAMASGVGYQIVDLSSVKVTVNASEQIATSVNVGDAVTINIPSMTSNSKFTGSITEIPPGANADGTYTIKINIPNSSGELKAGMFAEVYFAKATSNNAVIVPRDAVMDDDGNYYLYVADGNTAKKVDVTVGIDTGDTIEVTSGITLNDKVVTKGQTYLADGDEINIVSDNGEAVEVATEATTTPADGEEAKKK
jgi:RND family efflux transporter MFP subunit